MQIEDYEYEIQRQRREKKIYFVGLLLVAVLAIAVVSYNQSAYDNLDTAYNSLQSRYNSLSSNYAYQGGQINQLQQEMENMLKTYDQQSYTYASPGDNVSLGIWGLKATVQPNSWIAWALLDTFVNHLNVQSNASAEYVIVDLQNFVQLYQNKPFVSLVDYTGTNFTHTERLSQGCSGYLLVILDHSSHPILLTPDVTAIYAPTAFVTGQCSLP